MRRPGAFGYCKNTWKQLFRRLKRIRWCCIRPESAKRESTRDCGEDNLGIVIDWEFSCRSKTAGCFDGELSVREFRENHFRKLFLKGVKIRLKKQSDLCVYISCTEHFSTCDLPLCLEKDRWIRRTIHTAASDAEILSQLSVKSKFFHSVCLLTGAFVLLRQFPGPKSWHTGTHYRKIKTVPCCFQCAAELSICS